MKLLACGPRAVLAEFDTLAEVMSASNAWRSAALSGVVDVVPAARTVLVVHDGSFDTLEYYSSFMIFRATAQAFLEPADPINIASSLPAERAVLMQEGIGDLVIPNFTTENLAAAMRLSVPAANVIGTVPLQVLSHEDPAKYLPPAEAKVFNGHNVFGSFAPVRSQAMRFLQTKGVEYQVP